MLTLLFWLMMHGQAKVATPCPPPSMVMNQGVTSGIEINGVKYSDDCFKPKKKATKPAKREWMGEQDERLPILLPPAGSVTDVTSTSGQTETCVTTLEGAARYPYVPLCRDVKPVEHVIEIRTKREEAHPKCPDHWVNFEETAKACKCPANFAVVVEGTPANSSVDCWRITRELWIDGTRFGVVKGLD